MKHVQQTHLKVLPTAKPTRLAQAVDTFLLDGEARNLSPRTLHYYDENLRPFLAYLEGRGITSLQAVTPNHIRAYLVGLQQRGLSGYTQHGAARAIRAFFNFSVAEGMLDESPMRRVKMPKLPKEILPAFTPEDVRAILKAPCSVIDTTRIVTYTAFDLLASAT